MRELTLLGMLLALPDRPVLMPPQLLLGDWSLERIELAGRRDQNAAQPNCVLRIEATEAIFIMNGQQYVGGLSGRHKIDYSTNPILIDLMPKIAEYPKLGLIRLEGDRMTMALSAGNPARPKDFENAEFVAYFVRVK